MAWRVARSLDVLLGQINAAAPRRSKASDGSIGDAAHATRDSDHNPWVVDGPTSVVTARDYTHDPAHGLDCEQLYQALVRSRDDRIKYVIWNRTITSGSQDTAPWVRRPYDGTNAHTKHLHLSVRPEKTRYDNPAPWAIAPPPVPVKPPPIEEDELNDTEKAQLAAIEQMAKILARQMGVDYTLGGPNHGKVSFPGWPQLGGKTLVDALAEVQKDVDAIKARLDTDAAA